MERLNCQVAVFAWRISLLGKNQLNCNADICSTLTACLGGLLIIITALNAENTLEMIAIRKINEWPCYFIFASKLTFTIN